MNCTIKSKGALIAKGYSILLTHSNTYHFSEQLINKVKLH